MAFSRTMRRVPEISDLRGWQLFLKDLQNDLGSVAPEEMEAIDANSVLGNPTAASASPTDIQATVNGHVLRLNAGTLGFGTITSTSVSDFTAAARAAISTTDSVSVDFTYTAGDITAEVLPAGVDHDLLLNYVADEHVAHTGVTLTAGAGLTGGGDISASRTFDVGAGTGITVNANDVAISTDGVTNTLLANMAEATIKGRAAGAGTGDPTDLTAAQVATIVTASIDHDALLNFVANEHIDHTAVTLTAGAGLTGGGDISANRTFDVGAGTGITVNANDVAITTAGVTNSLLANMAADTIKGRANGAGTGDPTDLTAAQVATIISSAVASALNITSGTYTPTLTNVTNLDASTAFDTHYLRVGSTVVVSGQVSVDPTALAATELGISLPIASNIGANSDVGGAAYASVVTQGAAILGDSVNDRARMLWLATDTANRSMFFCFAYQVI